MAELTKKCKRLWTKPGIRWLCGYFFVLLCGVGLVYYWRVAYSLGAGMPGFAAATTLIICGGFSAAAAGVTASLVCGVLAAAFSHSKDQN